MPLTRADTRTAWYEGLAMIDQRAIFTARRALGRRLAAYRKSAGLRQEELASLVQYGRSSVANVETGRQKGSTAFWRRCDEVLGAAGVLMAAYDATEADVQTQREEFADRAACIIRDGDIRRGLSFADQVLDRLPADQHTELVYAIGRAAVAVVPPDERKCREAVELSARLALPVAKTGR
jgi:transcriptional regulator with XRE-family HTH domain